MTDYNFTVKIGIIQAGVQLPTHLSGVAFLHTVCVLIIHDVYKPMDVLKTVTIKLYSGGFDKYIDD